MTEPKIVVLPDHEGLAQHVARWLLAQANATPDRFSLALSGGSTPKRLYEILAAPPYHDAFPWQRTHVFWGDERYVPHESADSNYRMAREALLDHVPIPAAQIYPMPCGPTPQDAAGAYQHILENHHGAAVLDAARPLFDVNFLGLGEDGHTASLFPGTAALEETLAWVVPNAPAGRQTRLTLTYPAIASSRHIAFLVEGSKKAAILRRVLDGDRALPSARIAAVGDITWFIDEAAAA
jgi:6-phosphogluconolactonase